MRGENSSLYPDSIVACIFNVSACNGTGVGDGGDAYGNGCGYGQGGFYGYGCGYGGVNGDGCSCGDGGFRSGDGSGDSYDGRSYL